MKSRTSLWAGAFAACGAVAVLLAGCVAGPAPTSTSSATPTPTTSAAPTPSGDPVPASPSEPGGEAEPTHKPDPTPTATRAPGAPLSVELLTASWDASTGSVSAAAMVTDRVSSEGTCTLTVSQAGVAVSAEAPGEPGPSMTYCAALSVVLPAGASGQWTVTIDYAEEDLSGTTTGDVTIS